MAKVELKAPIVAEISELLDGAQSAVLVDYRGLTVEQDTKLRKQLREAGVTYKVYKNTMVNFAVKGTDFEGLSAHLEGPTAIAVSKLSLIHISEPTRPEVSRLSLLSHQETNCLQNSLEASSHLLQTLLVLLSRLLKKKKQLHNSVAVCI